MSRKLVGVFFLAMLLGALGGSFVSGAWPALGQALSFGVESVQQIESALSQNFPAADLLKELRVSLNYLGGSKEQNGIFIADDMLMLDVTPGDTKIVEANTQAILSLAKAFARPSYVMLLPTACVIQQSKVPYNSVAPLFNQQRMIDDVYRQTSGVLTAIDVYPTLFNHQDEYLYYRTENAPTGLGGYYIYSVAAKKLGLQNLRGLDQFDVNHIDYNYYGNLYAISPFQAVPPDRISTYIFSAVRQSYGLTHYDENGERQYFTLYPEFKAALGSSKDVILGGVSPIVDIEVGNPQYKDQQLLVLGDSSMQSYLPFLLAHYSRITFLDSASVTPELLSKLDFEDYIQVLFAYSVDTYLEKPLLTSLTSSIDLLTSAEENPSV